MRIDNSACRLFLECPLKYRERYEENLELTARDTESLDFGTRFHELQANRNARSLSWGVSLHETPLPDPRLEAECQATFQAYLQHYGEEPREVVDVERTLVVPMVSDRCPRCQDDGIVECYPAPNSHYCSACDNLYINPARHELAFKIDLLFREPGGLAVLDYKTEKRQSQYNTPEAWAARSQVALYQWAASLHYHEPVTAIYLDITTRQSPKGNEPPLFQRQRLVRTANQQAGAVRNIVWVADQIEAMRTTGFWPSNTDKCKDGWRKCDYYQLHVIGRTDGNLRLYHPAKPYLDL